MHKPADSENVARVRQKGKDRDCERDSSKEALQRCRGRHGAPSYGLGRVAGWGGGLKSKRVIPDDPRCFAAC